jgi:hypothetical protein
MSSGRVLGLHGDFAEVQPLEDVGNIDKTLERQIAIGEGIGARAGTMGALVADEQRRSRAH